jgi:curved DNA binding protein
VKVDLAVHIDGYIASVAHTFKVGVKPSPEAPISGKEADVMLACYQAADVAMGTIKPGNTSTQVAEAVGDVAKAYGVNVVMGTTMQQMKRFVINGNKAVSLREEPETKLEECTFEANEVYSVDVAISSGEGKPREQSVVPTVFKRAVEKSYQLKMKAARALLSVVNSRFPTLPFSLRSLEDEKQVKLGLRECLSHELLHAYPVLFERPGDIVAHCKFTVLLLPSGTTKITGVSLEAGAFTSDKELGEDAKTLLAELAERAERRKNKKNKKKKAAGGASA